MHWQSCANAARFFCRSSRLLLRRNRRNAPCCDRRDHRVCIRFCGGFSQDLAAEVCDFGAGFRIGVRLVRLIGPKSAADWAKDVAILPEAEINGDNLIVRHIRNFHYRSDADFDADYYDNSYDLNQVRTEGIWVFDIPFEEFRRRSRINDKVKQVTDAPYFSAQIRKDLPSIRR